ncbi:MAG: hypothetical protein ACOVOX_16680, partial [Burkholderiaceae bacterium]
TCKLFTPAGTVNVVAPGVVKFTVTALAAVAAQAKGSSSQRHSCRRACGPAPVRLTWLVGVWTARSTK